MDNLALILAIWSSVISTVLLINKIQEHRYRVLHSHKIHSFVNEENLKLYVEIVNSGSRPITIREVELFYGTQQIMKIQLDDRKLEESDFTVIEIERGSIQNCVAKNSIEQRYRQTLRVRATFSAGKRVATYVKIPISVINFEYEPRARDYIAADVYLGFSPMDSIDVNLGLLK